MHSAIIALALRFNESSLVFSRYFSNTLTKTKNIFRSLGADVEDEALGTGIGADAAACAGGLGNGPASRIDASASSCLVIGSIGLISPSERLTVRGETGGLETVTSCCKGIVVVGDVVAATFCDFGPSGPPRGKAGFVIVDDRDPELRSSLAINSLLLMVNTIILCTSSCRL